MSDKLSEIKVAKNNTIDLHLEDAPIKNVLIIGNTINLFGMFDENGNIEYGDFDVLTNTYNSYNRSRLKWIRTRALEGTKFTVIGEQEEKEYYELLFNKHIKNCFDISVNWKFMETKEPADYIKKLEYIQKKNMKFDYVIANPPYGSYKSNNLDAKCINYVIDNAKKLVVIMPFHINSCVASRKKLYESKHISRISLVDPYKSFNISVYFKYLGIFEIDTTKEYDKITIVDIDKNEFTIDNTKEGRDLCNAITIYNRDFVDIMQKTIPIYNKLHNTYKRMIDDSDYFIYEENEVGRHKTGKKYQHKLERVKKYLKEGTYKYCLYKGSFNNDYDEVQEWTKDVNPDELFNGQICWLCNDDNVYNNMKYWMNSPLFDFWRRYTFGDRKDAHKCNYYTLPALPFNMDENEFKTYVNNLYVFSEAEKEVLRKFNVHNIDNNEYERLNK